MKAPCAGGLPGQRASGVATFAAPDRTGRGRFGAHAGQHTGFHSKGNWTRPVAGVRGRPGLDGRVAVKHQALNRVLDVLLDFLEQREELLPLVLGKRVEEILESVGADLLDVFECFGALLGQGQRLSSRLAGRVDQASVGKFLRELGDRAEGEPKILQRAFSVIGARLSMISRVSSSRSENSWSWIRLAFCHSRRMRALREMEKSFSSVSCLIGIYFAFLFVINFGIYFGFPY